MSAMTVMRETVGSTGVVGVGSGPGRRSSHRLERSSGAVMRPKSLILSLALAVA